MTRLAALATVALTAVLLLAGPATQGSAETTGPTGALGASQNTTGSEEWAEGWTGYAPLAVAPQANLPDLEDEVMCPICGTLLGLSQAPAADRQRIFMRKLIAEGKDEQEIKDALVAEYGPQVLGMPDDERVNFWVYVVPLAGLILGAVGVLWAGLKWRRTKAPAAAAAGASAPAGPSGADAARLDRELDDYDR